VLGNLLTAYKHEAAPNDVEDGPIWDQLSKTRAPAHIRAGALVFSCFTTPILVREEINPLIGVPDPAEQEQFWLYLLWKEDRVPDLWKH